MTTKRMTEILIKAQDSSTGYEGRNNGQMAVYVAVGSAAEKRGQAGKVVIGVEWRKPEYFGDDDLSVGGYLLKPDGRSTRVAREFSADDIDAAVSLLVAGVSPAVARYAIGE